MKRLIFLFLLIPFIANSQTVAGCKSGNSAFNGPVMIGSCNASTNPLTVSGTDPLKLVGLQTLGLSGASYVLTVNGNGVIKATPKSDFAGGADTRLNNPRIVGNQLTFDIINASTMAILGTTTVALTDDLSDATINGNTVTFHKRNGGTFDITIPATTIVDNGDGTATVTDANGAVNVRTTETVTSFGSSGNNLLFTDETGAVTTVGLSDDWKLGGNLFLPSNSYLGTAGSDALSIRTNGDERYNISPTGEHLISLSYPSSNASEDALFGVFDTRPINAIYPFGSVFTAQLYGNRVVSKPTNTIGFRVQELPTISTGVSVGSTSGIQLFANPTIQTGSSLGSLNGISMSSSPVVSGTLNNINGISSSILNNTTNASNNTCFVGGLTMGSASTGAATTAMGLDLTTNIQTQGSVSLTAGARLSTTYNALGNANSIIGLINTLSKQNTSTASSLIGVSTNVINSGAGTVTTLYGNQTELTTTGAVTTAQATRNRLLFNGGSISSGCTNYNELNTGASATASSSLTINQSVATIGSAVTNFNGNTFSMNGGGSVTNSYGYRVLGMTGTNKWAFMNEDVSANNAFAGNTRIGGTTTPTSTLHVSGSIATQIVSTTSNYTVLSTDATIIVNNGAGNVTITMPLPSAFNGRRVTIARAANSTGTVTISGTNIQSLTLGTYGASTTLGAIGTYAVHATFQSDGTNWYFVN